MGVHGAQQMRTLELPTVVSGLVSGQGGLRPVPFTYVAVTYVVILHFTGFRSGVTPTRGRGRTRFLS